jgi:hypothetical protein
MLFMFSVVVLFGTVVQLVVWAGEMASGLGAFFGMSVDELFLSALIVAGAVLAAHRLGGVLLKMSQDSEG